MKKFFLFLFPVSLLLTAVSCADDEPDGPLSIVETAQASDDLSLLVEALQAANLVSALEQNGPFTVFAPSNTAFQALLDSDPSWNTISDIPTSVLTSVLLFHVVEGKVMSNNLTDTYVNTLSTGPNAEAISLQVKTTGGVQFNGIASPITVDVEASNGVIHIIDRVMLPPALPNLALNNANFTSLVAALTDSRHTTNYVALLSGAGPFTVFAPTNSAFQALLDSNPAWNNLGDIPIATIEAVLNYHVVANANVQADQLSDGQMIQMFDGNTLTVDLSNGAKLNTSSGQSGVEIVLTDVQGTNGVVHVIGSVLLP